MQKRYDRYDDSIAITCASKGYANMALYRRSKWYA